jgi:hypothetical protein
MIAKTYVCFDAFCLFWAAKNKANQTQFYLAPRPALGVEKTKPIL